MRSRPKITLAIHTASRDDFLQDQGVLSYFHAVTQNLLHQDFKDFEFVFVDAHYESNKAAVDSRLVHLPFVVKHVPVHAAHRYWYDKGHTYISAAKNTALLYADGELFVTCDDAEFFPATFLAEYWEHYTARGVFMHACHKRMRSIIVDAHGVPVFPVAGDIYVNDQRLPSSGIHVHANNWAYAGTSCLLEDALRLNGFSENMDGYKALEDCDFGMRLVASGRRLLVSATGFMYILDHTSYTHDLTHCPVEFVAVESYGLVRAHVELSQTEANRHPLTEQHLKIIQRETLKYRQFDPLAPENKAKLDVWLGVPCFDLREERRVLRASSEWRW